MSDNRNIRIGDVLIEYGYITEEQLMAALAIQKEDRSRKIGEILLDEGFVTEKQVAKALAKRLNLELVEDVEEVKVDASVAALVPQNLAEKYKIIPINEKDGIISCVTSSPLDFYAQEDVRQLTGHDIRIIVAVESDVDYLINKCYSEVSVIKAVKSANIEVSANAPLEEIDAIVGDDDTPVISFINSLLTRAFDIGVSDIHIEPYEAQTLVRMRIDGTITDYVTLQKSLHQTLIARIKIMSSLDIAERRVPQDGHFKTKIKGNTVNVRVSLIPTVFGEKAVMRILANNTPITNVTSYGMDQENYLKFRDILKSPNGIIYISGPTGSGKTTTLYMVLEEFSKRQISISTIEDPVEKNLPHMSQMQVNTLAGLTFENGLRALLRQDPDVIMVGETRDNETASISVRAAITGHLVFSTLHTNSAVSAIVRLADMGVEPYLIANSLVGVVAQRLMRKICPECGKLVDATDEDRKILGEDIDKVMSPVGCAKCNNTGYSGRIAVHEIVAIDREIRNMIVKGAEIDDIEDYAIKYQGMKTLQFSARELVKQNKTTIEEYLKIAYNV